MTRQHGLECTTANEKIYTMCNNGLGSTEKLSMNIAPKVDNNPSLQCSMRVNKIAFAQNLAVICTKFSFQALRDEALMLKIMQLVYLYFDNGS